MTIQNIGLMKALNAKMDYLNKKQEVIAQNIANADTPGYRSHDLKPIDFSRVLKNVTNSQAITPAITDDRHMPPVNAIDLMVESEDKYTYEVAPAENAVILEEQMIKAGKVAMDYSLMMNIARKQTGMIRTALGRGAA